MGPGASRSAPDAPAPLTIAIAGNPNCGKSALFNALTGIRQTTGNWPGVTVERKAGRCRIDGREITVVDLPGIYSFDAASLDEKVTRDYLLTREADLVVNVVDAANLERNLYFTVQLLEMGVPLVVAMNMMDVARRRGIRIDADALARRLGCPVVPIVATTLEGLSELQARMLAVADARQAPGFPLAHDDAVEQALQRLQALLVDTPPANRRWVALKMLEGDEEIDGDGDHAETVAEVGQWVAERIGNDVGLAIADSRYTHAHILARSATDHMHQVRRTFSDYIDRMILGRWTGVPIFLVVMYLMFLFAIDIGGAFIDLFDGIAGALFVDGFGELLTGVGAPDWLRVLLADGAGSGLQVVATFIPIITALYLFLAMLEDSGYMARAAFVMDRSMRAIGLPGKAFVPLIVGFGCNVPAVMATRTLENERERKLTILMNPFMSCGARLPVYALFAAAFFPTSGQNVVFLLYLTGILVAVLTGLAMKKSLLPGASSGFVMELPPYHLPTLRGVMLRAWDRVRLFVKEAGQVIVVMVIVLNLLNSLGTDGSFGNEHTEHSVLSETARLVTPAFAPLGLRDDNWPAVVGIFSGVLAKEVVVGTLDTLYSQTGGTTPADAQPAFDLWQRIREALATVPANLAQVSRTLTDPLGFGAAEQASTRAADDAVFGAMQARFDGQAGAFAYLLFVLLYFPCVATIGAIRRETGGAWAAFVAAWSTAVAYATATTYYQFATYAQHPTQSLLTILAAALSMIGVLLGLRLWARRNGRGVDRLDWSRP
ncbi:MAG: Fe(2+) transporter permease subunit FeoB [Chromatiaceae bacterium]|nr:Fe(2+) transporter permease subunit FeoB [Chromatiaceae bacterium]MCP5313956.1 Fe(2+) transporter permease subunit FeoB [Chromatiaceae bacterium]